MTCIEVKTSKPYNVLVEKNILARSGELVSQVVSAKTGRKALIVSDSTVSALYMDIVATSFAAAGFVVKQFVFQAGEEQKHLATVASIVEFCAKSELTRSDILVALGGGVVGDMTGFAASMYMRGVDFVQIPTTLLAMVDSSVGGKTGCNLKSGKNLVGAFYQPRLVLCDADVLKTLTTQEFACGVAEAIKTGILGDEKLFALFEGGLKQENLNAVIESCIKIKADVVCKDEKEGSLRKILNFGHTIGHAIEKLSNYTVPHGYAVAQGMMAVCAGADAMHLVDEPCSARIKQVLAQNNLPTTINYSAEELYSAVILDKKRSTSGLTLVIPKKIGTVALKECNLDEVRAFLQLAIPLCSAEGAL